MLATVRRRRMHTPAIRRMLQEPTDISTRVEAPSSNAGYNSRTSTRFFGNLIKNKIEL